MHLVTEMFTSITGTKMVHIPYKGTGPGVVDTIAFESGFSSAHALFLVAYLFGAAVLANTRVTALSTGYGRAGSLLLSLSTTRISGGALSRTLR